MEISPQRSAVPRLLQLRKSNSTYQKSKRSLFLSTWSFNDYVCRLTFGLIAYFFYLFYVNENTERGDQFRHRPDWLLPLEWLVPEFDLDPNWFLRGDEDETAKQGLLAVVDSLNKEAHLNKLGKLLATILLNEQLEQRSCVAKEVAEHNEYKANASLVKPNKNGVAALLDEEKRSDPPIVVLGVSGLNTTTTTFAKANKLYNSYHEQEPLLCMECWERIQIFVFLDSSSTCTRVLQLPRGTSPTCFWYRCPTFLAESYKE